MAGTIDWEGISGQKYTYNIHNIDVDFKEVPGNYIFAQKSIGIWKAIYIGETKNLNDRHENHEKRECALRNGATHIHSHINYNGESERKLEESDLVKKHQPICNK